MTNEDIKRLHTSLYIVLPEDVADDVSKKFRMLLKQSFLDGAREQRKADVEACDESMNQWYNETAEFLKNRPLITTE